MTLEGRTNMNQKAIAVMTSGGDAPGMNANVRSIVRTIINRNCRAYVVMEGYEGLVKGGSEYIKECNWEFVRGWLSEGGTNIGTARCMEFRERKGRLTACKNLIDAGIDALIVCGGDGSLTGADLFRSEWPSLIKELKDTSVITSEVYERYKHLNICGTVGSIDNDMSTTDATIGAYSALDRICTAIDYIEATAYSHSRAFVVEVMGRNCGWLALMAGIATSADYIFIPEKPAQTNTWEDQMSEIVTRHRANGKRTTIVIVAEGAIDNNLNPITCDDVHKVLSGKLKLDTRITILGHVQRGGTAVAYDRVLATLQGVEAVDAIIESTPEIPSPLIAINENKITRKPLIESVALTKSVADAIAAKDFDKAMSLRDVEFKEHLNNFMCINSSDKTLPKEITDKGMNIGIINIGAPAGGMNSAVYSITTYCMSQGHNALAIHNGFTGLVRHDSVHPLTWKEMIGWQSKGGCEIGTNRHTPSEAGIEDVAALFQKHKFDGLVIIGGFEALVSLQQLQEARTEYPAFRIPMVLIPATLSNNVPGTEYSLGSDTALNALMQYCDIIKQSASSTRARAFVVEVQGGNSGYLTTLAALACGAQISYVPEEGNISILQLEKDIQNLKDSFKTAKGRDRFGKLVLKATNASLKTWDSHTLAKVLTEEANGAFDAKAAIPGHVQQGGLPSPIDRTRGTRLAIRAVKFLEEFGKNNIANCPTAKELYASKLGETQFNESNENLDNLIKTASVLGTKGSQLEFTSIKQIYETESDLLMRMPKNIHWSHIREIADELVGRERI